MSNHNQSLYDHFQSMINDLEQQNKQRTVKSDDFITDLVDFATLIVIGAAPGAILWALFIH